VGQKNLMKEVEGRDARGKRWDPGGAYGGGGGGVAK